LLHACVHRRFLTSAAIRHFSWSMLFSAATRCASISSRDCGVCVWGGGLRGPGFRVSVGALRVCMGALRVHAVRWSCRCATAARGRALSEGHAVTGYRREHVGTLGTRGPCAFPRRARWNGGAPATLAAVCGLKPHRQTPVDTCMPVTRRARAVAKKCKLQEPVATSCARRDWPQDAPAFDSHNTWKLSP
jgi:hypothetical protein